MILNYICIYIFFYLPIVLSGVFSSICFSDILVSIKSDSSALVYALENVITRFYSKQTSNLYIAVHSSWTENNDLKPIDIAAKMIQIQSNRTSIMTFVIGDHIEFDEIKFYNLFVIDNYDSFRQASN